MADAIRRHRFTADEYQLMGTAGILAEGDRLELIHGEVVRMSPIGPRHNAAVSRANRAMLMAVGDRAIVQVQGSVRLGTYQEPEPDLVLLQPKADYYASRLAGPSDILLVVEVAESSFEYDCEVKARIYAEVAIREYWLVDLNTNLLSCYSAPQDGAYRSLRQYQRGEPIAPQALPECIIPVDVLLPVEEGVS